MGSVHLITKSTKKAESQSSDRLGLNKIAAIVVLAILAWIFSLYILYVLLSGFFQVVASL